MSKAYAYGEAKNLEFGTIDVNNFIVIEDSTEEVSFQNEIITRDRVGNPNGMFKTDKRGTITVRGLAKLSDVTTNLTLGSILTSTDFPELVDGDAYIESVSVTRTQGDVQRFEMTATALDGVDGAAEEITATTSGESGGGSGD